MIYEGMLEVKTIIQATTDIEKRKRREQTGFDTPVVYAVIDVYYCWEIPGKQLTREIHRLGSTSARMELKGIGEDLHKWWSMWFNAILRAKPYQFLNIFYYFFYLKYYYTYKYMQYKKLQVLHGCRQFVL